MIDVVYVVRRGDSNPELRYSLRSLGNLPHRKVWIVGYKPTWVTGVGYLPTIQRGTKWENSTANLLTACGHEEISDEFVYMNDDFFIVDPLDAIPVLHRGRVADVLGQQPRSSSYHRGAAETARLLKDWGYPDPISYELHVPMLIHGERMADVVRRATASRNIGVLHKRTLYGNVYALGGAHVADCKVLAGRGECAGPFLSTNDHSFRTVGRRIRALFPEPSPYEVDMNKDELLTVAAERGIEVSPSWTKAQIETALSDPPGEDSPGEDPASQEPRSIVSARGRSRRWRHSDGRHRSTTRGSQLDSVCEQSPNWKEI